MPEDHSETNKPSLGPADGIELSGSISGSSIGDEEFSSRRWTKSRSKPTPFSRLLAAISTRRRNEGHAYDYHAAPTDEGSENGQSYHEPPLRGSSWRKSRRLRVLKQVACYAPLAVLASFGVIHLLLVILGRKSLFWDMQGSDQYLPGYGKPGSVGEKLAHYPTDATRNVQPIPCHSHNDYWRRVPLFDAIHAGCIGVEADVWLFDDQDDLLVGHGTSSLTPERTFQSLYVNPLVELLDKMNPNNDFGDTNGHGVFDEDPDQTLVLLIDFKTNGRDLFPRVREELDPLREKGYLSHWDGNDFISRAVTAVGTGNTPFDLITQNQTYRDIFFDAPLDELWEDPSENQDMSSPGSRSTIEGRGQGKTGTGHISADDFNATNSYYASTSLQASIGLPLTGKLSEHQMNLLRGQIKGAKRRGLKSRYWETPFWPTSLRNRMWTVLVEEGADILNVDDLRAAAKWDWTKYIGHYWIDA